MKELKEKITYTYITQSEYDKGECNTGVYFPTFERARRSAEYDNPVYRPYYIVECVECFTVCGVVGDMRGEKICRTCKHAYTYQDQPYCDEREEEMEIEENGTCEKWNSRYAR